MKTARIWIALGAAFAPCPSVAPAQERSTDADVLLIDPLLIAAAGEVWGVVARADNPVWPGWDATSTPLLFYLPGRQDVLINHPKPPAGFVPYTGPIRFPGGGIHVRTGTTLIALDGQNTSKDVAGVQTLVVADTLSNRKQTLDAMIADPRPAEQKVEELSYEQLADDPYDRLGFVVHEAFHVYQFRRAPDKGGNEAALAHYPTLSVANNVGFALEGEALAEALRGDDADRLRRAALRFVAVREDRRSELEPGAVAYEDGTEFNEGLAKYAEYRLTQALEGREPGAAMRWMQGFRGYGDLSGVRAGHVDRMRRHMRGEMNVNNDPYGAAPLRMRLYFSGMAIAAVLDLVAPGWKRRIFEPGTTLTGLLRDALDPKDAELEAALAAAKSGPDYAALVQTKRELARGGEARIAQLLAEIEDGPNTTLVIDYAALGVQRMGMSYTPFGVTAVDRDRTIYRMVPFGARLSPRVMFRQTEARPVLQDRKRSRFTMQLTDAVSREALASVLPVDALSTDAVTIDELMLPGVRVNPGRTRVEWKDDTITFTLLRSRR